MMYKNYPTLTGLTTRLLHRKKTKDSHLHIIPLTYNLLPLPSSRSTIAIRKKREKMFLFCCEWKLRWKHRVPD